MSRSQSAQSIASDPVCWVLQNSPTKASTKLVLVSLAAGTRHQKCVSSVPVSQIMRESGLSRTQAFSHLRILKRLGEIRQLGFHRQTGARVYHLAKFCESGSSQGVRLAGFCCPYVQAFQRDRQPVRTAAYINTKLPTTVREAGLRDRPETSLLRAAQPAATATPLSSEERIIREWTEPYGDSYDLHHLELADGSHVVRMELLQHKRPPVPKISTEEFAQLFSDMRQQIAWLGQKRSMATVVPILSEAQLDARRRELLDQGDRLQRQFPPERSFASASATTDEPLLLAKKA